MTESSTPVPSSAEQVAQMRTIASEQGWTDATFVSVLLNIIEGDPDFAARAHAVCVAIAEGDASTPAEPGESFDDFDATYGAVRPEEEMAFSFEQVRDSDPHHVWSIVDGEDGNLWLLPGFRVVNATGDYVKSERPWQDESVSFRWDA